MKRDSQIFDLIAAERNRQMHGIELIASENFVSDQVMEAMGSVLTNKYAEGYPGARYYGSTSYSTWLITMTESADTRRSISRRKEDSICSSGKRLISSGS